MLYLPFIYNLKPLTYNLLLSYTIIDMQKKALIFASWLVGYLILLSILSIHPQAFAQQLDNVSIINGNPPVQNSSQPAHNSYSNKSDNPILLNGSSTAPFVASISAQFVDFGIVIAGEPLLRDTSLSVFPGASTGFQLSAFENQEPSATTSSSLVPDTTCDNGACDETIAALWNGPLTYGFGYRCQIDNTGCNKDFSPAGNYKQFANLKKGEQPQPVFSAQDNSQFDILYKLNIPQTDSGNVYQNTVYFIFSPQL